MWNKKMYDKRYFLAHTTITFALNKVLGTAKDAKVDQLTDDFFKTMKGFDRAMEDLAKKQQEL